MGVTEGLPWEDKLTALHHGAQPFNGHTVPHPCESVLCRMSPRLSPVGRHLFRVCLVLLSCCSWGLRMAVVESCLGIPYCSVFPLEEPGIWEGDVVVLERLSVFQDACVMRSLSYTGSRKSQGFLG